MLEWSEEIYTILGFAREANPTLDLVFDRIHPDDRQRLLEIKDRAARDGMDIDAEHRLLMPNGDIRYLHVVGHAGHQIGGDLEYIGVLSDITERKLVEQERQALSQELKESNSRLEQAQRVAHLGYWVWDLETNQVIWSDETYRIFGVLPQVGSFDIAKVSEMIHPDDRESVFRTAAEAIRSGTRADCEHRLLRPNGEMRVVHSLGDLNKNSAGRTQMFGTTQDITERKVAEQALRRSQFYLSEGERLAHMGSWASRDLGVRWSDDLDIYWSDEVYKIFGFDPRNGPPNLQQFLAAVHPQDRASLAESIKTMHEEHCASDTTTRIIRPNGEIRYVRCVSIPVVEDGIFQGYHGTTMDVTQHELLTQELRHEQAYFAEAQKLTHTGSWASNLVTRQVFHSSEENNRIYGFDVSQCSNPFDLHYSSILAEDEPALRAKLEDAVRTGADFDVEYRIRRADGAIRYLRGIGHHNPALEFGDYFGITMDVTDRKRVEEESQALSTALQQSNARLEEAQRLAHIGHYEWNLIDNRVTYSEELCRIWGIPPQKGPFDVATIFERIHPEDRDSVSLDAEETIRSGTHAKSEHRIVLPDGEVRYVLGLGTVKRDASGRAYEMFGTGQDVTDRKRAEEALQRSDFYLNEGQRLAHMGSWAFGAAGFDYWSPELLKIHGLDPNGKPPTVEEYLGLVHPEDRDFVGQHIRKILTEHREFDFTKRIVRRDRNVRYVRWVGVPIMAGETFKGFVGTGMDVTEHELLTRELRREQAYLSEAQNLAHIGSWATNFATGQIHHISDETVRLHGFDPAQSPIPLERFYDTIHPEDRPTVEATLAKAISGRTDYDIREYRICLSDGTIRFLRTIGHHGASEQIGEYIGITMDITERKRAEEERERLHKLEAELAHINRVNIMGEMAGALAHEIKQPIAASITSANACLRWLAHDPPDLERARAAAARIEQDGNRAADVIDRLRSLYKKGSTPAREMVDIKDVIREIMVLLRTEASRNLISINSELDAEMPNIMADRVQLQQVFMNLMVNAVEAMKDAGGEMTIRSRLDSEHQLIISISDTGVGFAAECTDRIFDAFHTTKPHGMGMGLAITRSIIESHGGRIWATRNEEAGVTFHFTLPYKAEARA
jgi:PAS domain S-box-containing protein